MLDLVTQLNEIGWMTVIAVIILIVALIPNIIESWDKLLSSLGLVTKKSLHENKQEERINYLSNRLETYQNNENIWHQQLIQIRDNTQKNQEHMVKNMEAISQSLNDLKFELQNEKIERMRWRILDFAFDLQNGNDAEIEQFNNVIDTYTQYEDLIEKLGKTNGLVNVSIDFIQCQYQKKLNNKCDDSKRE